MKTSPSKSMHTKANPRLAKKARAPESVQLSQASLDSNGLITETAQLSAHPKKRHKHKDAKDPHDASTNTDVDVLLDTEASPTESLQDKSAIIQSWHVAEAAAGNHSRMVDGIPSASAWPSHYRIFGGLAAVGIGAMVFGGGDSGGGDSGGGDSGGGNYALDFSDFCASMDAKNFSPQTIFGQAADSSIGTIRMHVSGGFDGGLIPLNLNQTLPQYHYTYLNGNVTHGNIDAKGLVWNITNITDSNVQASFTLSTDVTASNSRHLWLEELSINSDSDLSTLQVYAQIIASATNQGNAGIGICDANIDIHLTESATANLSIAAHATGNAAANILINDLHVNVSAIGTGWHAEAYANITNFEATANIDADAVISIGNLSLEAYAEGSTESIDAVAESIDAVAQIGRIIAGLDPATSTDDTFKGITASASGDGASAHVTIDDINLKAGAIGLEVTGDISAEANLYSVKAKADAGGDAEVAIGHIAISASAYGSAEDKVYAYAGISWTLSANAKEGATALIDMGQIDIEVHATNTNNGAPIYNAIASAVASIHNISAFAEYDANASIDIEDINVFAYAVQPKDAGGFVSLDVSIDNIVANASGDFADAQINIGDIRLYGTGYGQNEVDASVSLANISVIASASYANASIHIDSIFLRAMAINNYNANNATSVGATASMDQIHAFATHSSNLVGAKANIDIGNISIRAEAYNGLGDTATAYAGLSNTIYALASGSGNAFIEIDDMYISARAEAEQFVFATAFMGSDKTVIYAEANDEANASIVIGNIDLIADAIGGDEGRALALMGLRKDQVANSTSQSAIYAGASLSANAYIDIGNINLDAEISIIGNASAEALAAMGSVHATAGDEATADIRIDDITLSAKALAHISAEASAILSKVSANADTSAMALVDIKNIYIHASASITSSSGDVTAIARMESLDGGFDAIRARASGGLSSPEGAEANIQIDDIDILAEAYGSGKNSLSANARIARITAAASGNSLDEALIDIGHINITASANIDSGSSSVYAVASLGVVEAFANLGNADVSIDDITINAQINATNNNGYAEAHAFMRGVSANAAIGGSADISIQDIHLSAQIAAGSYDGSNARAEFNFILAEADVGNAIISIQDNIYVKASASGAAGLTVSAIMGSDEGNIAILASADQGNAHISIGNLTFNADAHGGSEVTAYAGISYFIEAKSVIGGGDASIMIGNIYADAYAFGTDHVKASAFLGWSNHNDTPDGVIRAFADDGNAEVHITGKIDMQATASGHLDVDAYAYISSIQAEASSYGRADITIGDIKLFASGVATEPGNVSASGDALVDAWAGIGNHATNNYSHTSLNLTAGSRNWRANTTSASHFALGLNAIAGENGESSHITIGNIEISAEASGLLAVGGNADVSAYAFLWAVSAAASAGGDANIEIKDVDITARTSGGNDAKAYARLGEDNTRHWHYSATYTDDNSPFVSPSNITYDQYTGITASILGSNLLGDFVDDYTEAKVSIEDIVLSAHVTGGEGILAEARLYGINARAGDYSDPNPANGDVTVLIDGNIDIHATASGDTGVASAILGGEYIGIEAAIVGNADPSTYPGIKTSSLISITGNVNITAIGQGNVDATAKLHTVNVHIGSNVEATATVHIGGDVNLSADANNGTGDAIASAEFRASEYYLPEDPAQVASIQVDGNINIDASSDGGCIDLYLGIFNTGSNVEIDVGDINVGMYGTSPDAYGNITIIDNSLDDDAYELHFDNLFANVDVSGGQLNVSIAGVSWGDRAATFEGVGGDVNLMLSDSQVFEGIDLRNFDGQINMLFSNLTEPIMAEDIPSVGRLPSMFTLIFGYELNDSGHENSIVFESSEAQGEFNSSGGMNNTNFLYQAGVITDGNIDAALLNLSDVDFDGDTFIGDTGDTGYAFLDFTGSSIDIDDDPLTDNSNDHIGMLAYIEDGNIVGLLGLVGVTSLISLDIIQEPVV